MNELQDKETCAHKLCNCMAREDEEYCSVYCENAAKVNDTEISCGCGHAGCS